MRIFASRRADAPDARPTPFLVRVACFKAVQHAPAGVSHPKSDTPVNFNVEVLIASQGLPLGSATQAAVCRTGSHESSIRDSLLHGASGAHGASRLQRSGARRRFRGALRCLHQERIHWCPRMLIWAGGIRDRPVPHLLMNTSTLPRIPAATSRTKK
jgi:hypothetical protein